MTLASLALGMLLRVSPWLATQETQLAELSEAIGEASESPDDVAALVAIGYYESGRSWDCTLEGDRGESVSCWQVRVCRTVTETCSRARTELAYAASIARERFRTSERACRRLGDAWSQYTTGVCQHNREARVRLATAKWLVGEFGDAWRATTS